MKKRIEVPEGKHVIGISVGGHSYVRLLDSNGRETFRFDSSGEHITAVVRPGTHTIETDGKLGKIEFAAADRLRGTAVFDALKPPVARR